MEGFWNVLKRNSLVHEHYDSVDERMGRALYFLQNLRINIDCEKYIFRDPKPLQIFSSVAIAMLIYVQVRLYPILKKNIQYGMKVVGYHTREDGSIQEIIAPDHHRIIR